MIENEMGGVGLSLCGIRDSNILPLARHITWPTDDVSSLNHVSRGCSGKMVKFGTSSLGPETMGYVSNGVCDDGFKI
jgi:hypothetical protein